MTLEKRLKLAQLAGYAWFYDAKQVGEPVWLYILPDDSAAAVNMTKITDANLVNSKKVRHQYEALPKFDSRLQVLNMLDRINRSRSNASQLHIDYVVVAALIEDVLDIGLSGVSGLGFDVKLTTSQIMKLIRVSAEQLADAIIKACQSQPNKLKQESSLVL